MFRYDSRLHFSDSTNTSIFIRKYVDLTVCVCTRVCLCVVVCVCMCACVFKCITKAKRKRQAERMCSGFKVFVKERV